MAYQNDQERLNFHMVSKREIALSQIFRLVYLLSTVPFARAGHILPSLYDKSTSVTQTRTHL